MKSDLQIFMEKIVATKAGEKIEAIVTEQMKQEIIQWGKIGDMIQGIGAQRLADIWKRTKKKN